MHSIILLFLCGQTVPPSPEAWRDAWIAGATTRIERACAQGFATDEPLGAKQARWRADFLESMGLSPLPERTPLRPVITGAVETDKFKVEKIHFQSRPGLYVTANLYLPRNPGGPCPAVLYVCGHATFAREVKGSDGSVARVAYGSKVPYQHHPALFAENGYACLILDTLQLGEIEGTHHGTHRHGRWWWHDRGFTPAGVELWNAMRALDYLESRPEVDGKRLAVTGRSGGGATSWWLGAADPRVRAIVPVAGLADLRAHLIQGEMEPNLPGCVTGHCDCMYFHNVAGLDFAQVIALCAPRATLLGNSDRDAIFPVGGYRRPASLARMAFSQAGKPEAFALMETSGGHLDTPELRQGAMGWIDRHAAGVTPRDLNNRKPAPLDPDLLKVFTSLPTDQRNTTVDEWFVPVANHPIPQTESEAANWLSTQPGRLKAELARTSFAHWPRDHRAPPRLLSSHIVGERLVQKWSLEVEPGLELPVMIHSPARGLAGKMARIMLGQPVQSEEKQRGLVAAGEVLVMFAPRGTGETEWRDTHPGPNGKPAPHMTRRRLALLGATVESGQVFDTVQLIQALDGIPETTGMPLTIQAQGSMGVNALYASIFTHRPISLELTEIPPTHKDGPHYLHVSRWLEVPQAIAISQASSIRFSRANPLDSGWNWLEAMNRLGPKPPKWLSP